MTAIAMAIVTVALILGGLTGWLASIPADTEFPMGVLASISIGGAGSLIGVAIAAGLGLQPHSMENWMMGGATVVLTAAWLVGTFRAARGLFLASGAWR